MADVIDAEALLAGLDPAQRRAATALRGPVVILAGAGTGKTRTITHRIAYGVATGVYAPTRTLALTFTTRAAGELRARLRQLGAGEVPARTFHSAALSQLAHFWPQVVGGSAPRVLEGKARLLGEAADAIGLRSDQATLRAIAGEIEWRKVSCLSIAEYSAVDRPVPPGLDRGAVLALQQAYEDRKDELRRMDFEDVLLATAGMLETESGVAAAVREQYRAFTVDEVQDVSPLQERLLRLWVGARRDLCVVGDANQTIYGFTGASASFLLGFAREHQDAEVVSLAASHRSSPEILALANRLMRGRPGAIELAPAASVAGSASASASASATASGSAPAPSGSGAVEPGAAERVAVTRTSVGARAAMPIEPRILAFADDRAEIDAMVDAVVADLAAGIPASRIGVLVRINAQVPALERALKSAGIQVAVRGDAAFFERPEVREAIVHLLAAKRSTPAGAPLTSTVRGVLSTLGWSPVAPAAVGKARERWTSLDALHRLADDTGDETPLGDFLDDLLERQASLDPPIAEAVVVATMHAVKGLEFESVHVLGVAEGLVPLSYSTTPAQLDEERRLLYVAITRARTRLRISSAGRPPSRFLSELAPER